VRVIAARLADLGWRDTKVELTQDGAVRAIMPKAADDGHLEHLLDARGHFTFSDPQGNEFLTGEHIATAGFGMANQAGTDFSLSIAFDDEGKRIFAEKTTELVGQSITLKLDGNTLVSPGVNEPLTAGGVSIPGFALEPAREYAVMMRSGAMPYALEVAERTAGTPLLGEGVQNRLIVALTVVFALVALYFIIRQRLGGVVAAWMLLVQLALSYFFAALMRAGFTLVTLSAIWLGFLAVVFGIVVLFENVQEDIRRGRSVRQAVKESYAGRGHAALDVMAALLIICVVVIIIDAQGVVGSFAKVLGISLLVGLVLTQVALRVILNETLTLFGDRSALYASGVMKKEEE
jgi:protein-export membrane protein SecD